MNQSEILRACQACVPLGPWLDRCAELDIPHVPAAWSSYFPTRQLLDALDGEDTPELRNACEWVNARVAEARAAIRRVMVRWECCASDELKYAASGGQEFDTARTAFGRDSNPYQWFSADDVRLHECTVTAETRLCVRPWITARRHLSYPIEFRVFVGENGLLGVSSYYSQRPLSPDLPSGSQAGNCLSDVVRQIIADAERLLDPNRHPLGFTADFIIGQHGWPLFLEGGPPHRLDTTCSAHPCCMKPGEIHGVAYELRPGALQPPTAVDFDEILTDFEKEDDEDV